MEEKIYKTKPYILKAMKNYRDKNRDKINSISSSYYERKKLDLLFIEKRKLYYQEYYKKRNKIDIICDILI